MSKERMKTHAFALNGPELRHRPRCRQPAASSPQPAQNPVDFLDPATTECENSLNDERMLCCAVRQVNQCSASKILCSEGREHGKQSRHWLSLGFDTRPLRDAP